MNTSKTEAPDDGAAGLRPPPATAGVRGLARSPLELEEGADENATAGFERLFWSCHARVLRYAERRLPTPDDAENVAAEVWAAAWARWRAGKAVELPWLYRVTANKIADHYRAAERGQAVAAALRRSAETLPAETAARERRFAVRAALLALSEREREAVMLTYWEGLRAADVAKVLGCGVPTVWAVLSRARKKLGTMVEQDATLADAMGGTQ
ncbi:MAG: RNA polymerase sigma factor [Bifidobacteriaceae bacterium]|nr:RNA polymerase sigma factor [Bifidobacteriaceae bacterium]